MTHPNHKLTMTARELKDALDSGIRIQDLCSRYGVNKAAIWRKLAKAGMPASHREQRKPVKTAMPVIHAGVKASRPVREGVMTWTTLNGAKVNLPLISFLMAERGQAQ